MPRKNKPARERVVSKVRAALVGAPYRITTPKGGWRDFADVSCAVDQMGNLAVYRVIAEKEPKPLIVYAPGAWDSFELIVAVLGEEQQKTPPEQA
jgi:hypothetical protein